MKLSTRANYGIRAIYELARWYGKGPLQVKQISKRQDIPVRYLEQLLFRLKKSGVIESVRGPTGGYVLKQDPGNTSVGDIFRILEGPVQMTGCVQSDHKQHCCRQKNCIAILLWSKVEKRIEQVFDEISLLDLCHLIQDHVDKVLSHDSIT